MRLIGNLAVLGAAAAVLAACGGPAVDLTAPSGSTVASSLREQPKPGALLYISDTETSRLYVYSYPKGKLEQTISYLSVPAGECVDKKGDVFVANTGASDILEYAHGGSKPIATLQDTGYFPIGCAIDPTTGNLAVTNFSTSGSGQGDVVLYKRAKGKPTGNYMLARLHNPLLCGYDNTGNLFVDGSDQSSSFQFAELRQGKAKLTSITLDQSIGSGGGVQWDGMHVAVGDQTTNTVYQFSIQGTAGKETGATTLSGGSGVFQFWIDGSNLIGPNAYGGSVGIWAYPAGGSPTKTIGGLYAPLGAVVSPG